MLEDAVDHGGLAQRGVEEGVAVEDGQIASLPGSSVPRRLSRPRMRAGLMVTARRAASSGSPLPMQRPMCMGSHLVPALASSVKENSTPRLKQGLCVVEVGIPDFPLAQAHGQGAHHAGDLLLGQNVGNHVALGAVLKREIEPKLLGDADGGVDVVAAMAVDSHSHLAAHHGHEGASFMSFLGGFSPFFSASRSASEYSTAAVSVSRSMAAVIMRVMGGCFFMSP